MKHTLCIDKYSVSGDNVCTSRMTVIDLETGDMSTMSTRKGTVKELYTTAIRSLRLMRKGIQPFEADVIAMSSPHYKQLHEENVNRAIVEKYIASL